ncbi:MAG TPA: hypothetical protein V6D48_25790 [Oculatellaceae cyanobacterium]
MIRLNPNGAFAYINRGYNRGLARSCMGDNQGSLEDLQQATTLCSNLRNTALDQRVQEAIRNLQI